MSNDFIPSREADLVTWTGNFATQLAALTTAVGISVAQSTTFNGLNTSWVDAFVASQGDMTRTPAGIIAKNNAKLAVVENARLLAGIIQKFPGTTDVQRAQLGITIRQPNTPIGVPTVPPNLEIVERLGTMVRIRLHDGSSERRGKPVGVASVRVYSATGATPPESLDGWTLEGSSTRTIIDLDFPGKAPGTVVWLTAQWLNPRQQAGPGCAAVSAVIAGGAISEAS